MAHDVKKGDLVAEVVADDVTEGVIVLVVATRNRICDGGLQDLVMTKAWQQQIQP
jgi:hypothetical protein